MVKVGQNAPELSSWAPQNGHCAFLGPKFTKFLPELWSLTARTLLRGLDPEIVSATDIALSYYLLVL